MVRSYNSIIEHSVVMTSHNNGSWHKKQRSLKNLFRTNSHRLFGNPLVQLSTEEDLIPKPIQNILLQLFRKGPTTTGIFRKSANQRTVKQVRLSLDQGKEVDFEEKSAIVLATVLKDFCRSLPDSLIISELYDDLVATKTTTDAIARSEQIKRLLQNLPKEHYDITMKFMCALHHIQRFSERNNMNSYNLSICVSPSIMWPPTNSKLAVTEQASGSSDVVCFIIDNYINIFSSDNEYVLGAESDIQLDDGHGEDSDSGTDQFIYKCRQPSMDDTEEEHKNDSEKENHPPTPEFVFTADETHLESPFAHSDSSIGTNDSDEHKPSLIFNVPSISLVPEKIILSKSSPSSPSNSRRREMLPDTNSATKNNDTKIQSDISDHESSDHNEQFQRKLLRQPRNKRVLSSSTTSAELIEHKRHISEPISSPKVAEKKRLQSDNQVKNVTRASMEQQVRTTSPVDSVAQRIAKKSVISQPMIQHFATEYYATPNVIFHSVDRRRQPAAPSYEEHIQRTQSKQHRIIQSTTVKQPIVAHATLVERQKVENYQPLKTFVKIAEKSAKQNTNINNKPEVKLEEKNVTACEKRNSPANSPPSTRTTIEVTFDSIVDSINQNMPVSKVNVSKASLTESMSSLSSNSSNTSSMETTPPRNDIENKPVVEDTVAHDPVKKLNVLPTAPKPNKNKIAKLELFPKHDIKSDSMTSSSSTTSTCDFLTPKSDVDNVFLSPDSSPASPLFDQKYPKSNSPFSLNMKSEQRKNVPTNNLDNRAHSLQLQKTSLTKAPMKLEQLRGTNVPSDTGRVITARELRRTNRRLKSEIRNAFNDGFVKKQQNDNSLPPRTLKTNINGHFRSGNLNKTNVNSLKILGSIERQNNQDNIQKQTKDLLEVSKLRYSDNNNVTEHDAYKQILSQDESYV